MVDLHRLDSVTHSEAELIQIQNVLEYREIISTRPIAPLLKMPGLLDILARDD
jgi:hypothetical protein